MRITTIARKDGTVRAKDCADTAIANVEHSSALGALEASVTMRPGYSSQLASALSTIVNRSETNSIRSRQPGEQP